MQDHPIGEQPGPVSASAERERGVDRAVLLALLTDPSDYGEPVCAIATAIDQPRSTVEDAVEFLIWVGLLRRRGASVSAAGAAMYLAELWPLTR